MSSIVLDFFHSDGGGGQEELNYLLRLRGTPDGIVDLSGKNNVLNYNVNYSLVPGVWGGEYTSLKCNGTNSYLDITHIGEGLIDNSDFTVSVWITDNTFKSNSQHNTILETRQINGGTFDDYPSLQFGLDSRSNSSIMYGFIFGPRNPDDSISSWVYYGEVISFTTPYHLAVVRYNGITYLYKDGIRNDDSKLERNEGIIKQNNHFLFGLSHSTGANDPYSSFAIDDLCIIKGKALWTENFTPPTTYLPDKI